MKKYLFFVVMMLFAAGLQAQPSDNNKQDRGEKIQALYAAFITQKLKLTPDEAQKFWPVHVQYNEEVQAVNKSGLQEIEKEEGVLKVKKKYAASFTKILGADRCNEFYIQDRAFRDKIKTRLKDMQQKRKEKKDKNGE